MAAPAVLAMYVLNTNITFIDATVAVLGWRLAETSEGQVNSFEVLPPSKATQGDVEPSLTTLVGRLQPLLLLQLC